MPAFSGRSTRSARYRTRSLIALPGDDDGDDSEDHDVGGVGNGGDDGDVGVDDDVDEMTSAVVAMLPFSRCK